MGGRGAILIRKRLLFTDTNLLMNLEAIAKICINLLDFNLKGRIERAVSNKTMMKILYKYLNRTGYNFILGHG